MATSPQDLAPGFPNSDSSHNKVDYLTLLNDIEGLIQIPVELIPNMHLTSHAGDVHQYLYSRPDTPGLECNPSGSDDLPPALEYVDHVGLARHLSRGRGGRDFPVSSKIENFVHCRSALDICGESIPKIHIHVRIDDHVQSEMTYHTDGEHIERGSTGKVSDRPLRIWLEKVKREHLLDEAPEAARKLWLGLTHRQRLELCYQLKF
ncbi:hypothetical protein B0H11DRAFT_2239734 [Mycena galericulata]|nr:hypothetical protein B0H11DRAFT_2239734 [Mycena galericulata]